MKNSNYTSGLHTVRSLSFSYCSYHTDVDIELHFQLANELATPESLATWPQFSLDKIAFLPGESLQDLLIANALVLSKYSGLEVKTIYLALANKKISLASPFFNNLRRVGKRNFASCFILEVEDSLESIMKSLTYCATISKAGGGCGVNIGLVRASGAAIANKPNAAQSINTWVKLFDQVCVAVNQLGQRPGAMTVALPIWHRDIEDFLEIGTESGDLRSKAFNIQPQVVIGSDFMSAVRENLEWPLYCPSALRASGLDPRKLQSSWQRQAMALEVSTKSVSARQLWSKIQELQVTIGRPYIFFEDNANEGSPFMENFGPIRSANLCVESFSFFRANEYIHTCSLGSVNLPAHSSLSEIEQSAGLMAKLIDASLDIEQVPIPEVQKHVTDFRTIGVGLMGLTDYLAANDKSYGDSAFIESVAKAVALGSYKASLSLAAEHGPCLQSASLTPSKVMLQLESEDSSLRSRRLQHGIRNALMLCTAPNTSTSITMGSSSSFLPPYSLGGFIEGNNDKASKIELQYEDWYYVLDQQSTPPAFVLEAALAIQKWTDAGISCEFLLVKGRDSSENKAFSELKFEASERGLKAIYYIRSSEALGDQGCGSGGCSN